jgi:CRISPR-associated protein Csb1
MSLTYEDLRAGVAGDAAGIRCRTRLDPLGGAGDKVFPPTYAADSPETRYAIENRYVPFIDGGSVALSVVLDSVASQANRLELALLGAIRDGQLSLPVTSVDFRPFPGVAGLDRISDFEAPHRIFDALLRDSYDGDHLFRNGLAGRAITEARPRNAAGLYYQSPHTLVFGGWDSTGPLGGRGAKYERAITSEIVAAGITPGSRTSSRIDPAGIELRAGPLFQAPDGTWALEPDQAVKNSKGEAVLYGATDGGRDPGKPSRANHGNVRPSIDTGAGGVTAREIFGTTVLSLIQLRRLRFPVTADGELLDGSQRAEAELSARTALAALGLAGAALAFESGFDLRSRCVLVTSGPVIFEAVGRDGSTSAFELTAADSVKLVAEAAARAAAASLPWRAGELHLRPADKLVELIRRSQQIAMVTGEETADS